MVLSKVSWNVNVVIELTVDLLNPLDLVVQLIYFLNFLGFC